MQWITRSDIHVDRVACPWLITRFIDSEAKFLFVTGYGLRFPNDAENLIKQFEVYDSLYAWCRLQTEACK